MAEYSIRYGASGVAGDAPGRLVVAERGLHERPNTAVINAIARVTGGNFRLIQRLCAQSERIWRSIGLPSVTIEVGPLGMLGVGTPGFLALVPRADFDVVDTWFASGLGGAAATTPSWTMPSSLPTACSTSTAPASTT